MDGELFMNKFIKIIRKVLLRLVAILLVFILALALYHHYHLENELMELQSPGQIIQVNEQNYSIYIKGNPQAEKRIVMLSGSAIVSPIYDFKAFSDSLLSEYQVIIIEENGYGYSDIKVEERNVETKLQDIRMLLEKVEGESPYIVLAHSMSGITALYWAQEYPDEVEMIIGLDMAVPDSYNTYDFDDPIFQIQINIAKCASWLGIIRIPGIYPLNTAGLSQTEIKQQQILMYRNAFNDVFLKEGEELANNAMKINDSKVSKSMPVLLITSNGKETGEYWISSQKDFAVRHNFDLIEMNCGHSIHQEKTEEVSSLIKNYINGSAK